MEQRPILGFQMSAKASANLWPQANLVELCCRLHSALDPVFLWKDVSGNGDRCQPASLRALLAETVDLHLIADAHLGIFLSGGIDSSAMVASERPRLGVAVKLRPQLLQR